MGKVRITNLLHGRGVRAAQGRRESETRDRTKAEGLIRKMSTEEYSSEVLLEFKVSMNTMNKNKKT